MQTTESDRRCVPRDSKLVIELPFVPWGLLEVRRDSTIRSNVIRQFEIMDPEKLADSCGLVSAVTNTNELMRYSVLMAASVSARKKVSADKVCQLKLLLHMLCIMFQVNFLA